MSLHRPTCTRFRFQALLHGKELTGRERKVRFHLTAEGDVGSVGKFYLREIQAANVEADLASVRITAHRTRSDLTFFKNYFA